MSNTIVVGVDGREQSRDAMVLAGALAKAVGGELVLAHVHPYEPTAYSIAFGATAASPLADEARDILRAAAEDAPMPVRTVPVAASSPPHGLQGLAEQLDAQMIVVGSSHRGRMGRVLLGSHAEAMIAGAPCAVAVAPFGLARHDWSIRHIAVGFDGRPESHKAVGEARRLAAACAARLELVGVVSEAAPPTWAPYSYAPDWNEIQDDRCRALKRQINAAAEGAATDVRVGDVVEQLGGLTTRTDLLVVGSRAYGPVRRVLLGGTARRVVRDAACPVIVVPRSAMPASRDFAEESPSKTSA